METLLLVVWGYGSYDWCFNGYKIMSETKYKGVKKSIRNITAGGCSIVEGKSPGVTFDCEKYLNDEEKLKSMSGSVKTYNINGLKGRDLND